ncbi:sigma-70 family RNA polymerase sigma factor [Methylomonas montana]|uniref:RNA polymerase sigma factor n=1 Tax=Methylomonas montana TaxID=3058963 RepID=UPI00265861E1|nr:sigma-70 family RNA polymerase sigma factor [Methylomonas montana]WKJ89275.1 sigma-70 family RNA polymerase sigma factor [Methylomonas montana]
MSTKAVSGVDEYALLGAIVDGDAKAFEAFYKLYYSRLLRFILRTTRQPELVEELIQETLLLVWQQPQRFTYNSKISTWVFGIAYRKALKAMSKNAKRFNDLDMDELSETIDDPMADLAQNIENQDWLNIALAHLSADQRAVIELTFFHGMSYQEIAQILDCPENTVKTRMFHARKKLHAFATAMEH